MSRLFESEKSARLLAEALALVLHRKPLIHKGRKP